ncbi:hydrogenase maturation protease [Desulforudis sp. 1088]|uniref:hydrogenase maturation protease n=2 Tax=Candidatus Desulforudis TaxID=471826 RepID=UPI003CE4E355
MAPAKIVVLGCGNTLAGDDGVGVEVLRALEQAGLPPGVSLVEAGAPGFGLLDLMFGAEKAIIVDAVLARGEPGRVFRWTEAEVPEKATPVLSVHDIKIRDTLQFGHRSLAEHMPAEVVIIGIAIEDAEPWHMGLSPAVAQAVPEAAQTVLKQIDAWTRQFGSGLDSSK